MIKSLNHQVALPPKPPQSELDKLAQIIEDRLSMIDKARKERVKRIQMYRQFNQDDYSGRIEEGGIYEYSNIGVPLMKSVCTSYASKLEDEVISSDPPFVAKARGAEDRDLENIGSKYWSWEIMDQIGWAESCSEAIWVLTSEGTAIKKRSWSTKKSFYPRTERWLKTPDGLPVMHGDQPIKEGSAMVERIGSAMFGLMQRVRRFAVVGKDEAGQDILGPEVTDEMQFGEVELKESVIHYDNAKSEVVPFENFYCDMAVSDIKDSSLLAHFYEKTLQQVMDDAAQTMEGEFTAEGFKQSGYILDGLASLKDAPDNSQENNKGMAGETIGEPPLNQAQKNLGESSSPLAGDLASEDRYKRINIFETYIKYDIDGDGIEEDLVVLFQRDTKKVFFIDWLVNCFADCEDPFTVHKFFRVPGRWYGMGPYEYMSMAQEFVDKTFNRMNLRGTMAANPITWIKPDNFVKPPSAQIKPGMRVQLKSAANINDSMGFLAMPSMENVEWQHFQFFVSLIQLATGVTNAAQGDISTLPSAATATGINTIVAEGNKLYRMFIRCIQRSLEEELRGLIRLIQQNVKEARVFRYSERGTEQVARMSLEDIRNLDFDVDIVLSKFGAQQKSESIKGSLAVVQMWLQTPPEYQQRLRPLYIDLLNTIGVNDADGTLPTTEELATDAQHDQAMQGVAAKIGEAIAKLQASGLDPRKIIEGDLMGVLPIIQQLTSQGPLPAQEAPKSAEGGGNLLAEPTAAPAFPLEMMQ